MRGQRAVPAGIYPADFPFAARTVAVGDHRLAYLDSGRGERTLLLVHGNPVSGYIYARLMARLAPHYRCVAPDLLGFGLSEKPADVAAYTLPRHIDLLAGFVAALDLRDVVLVVHDWGGPIGWGAALREPERYSQLVILNTLTEVPMRIRPLYWLPFHLLLRLPRLYFYLVQERNLFQRLGIGIMAPEDQAVFLRVNRSPAARAGIAAFPRLIPYKESHSSAPLIGGILQQVERWPIPALVMFSDRDSVFTARQGERFAHRLCDGRYRLIAGPRHFLQYEAPGRIAAEIEFFLQG